MKEKKDSKKSWRKQSISNLDKICLVLLILAAFVVLIKWDSRNVEGRIKLTGIQSSMVKNSIEEAVNKVEFSTSYFFVNKTDELRDTCIRNTKGEMIMENAGDTGYTVFLKDDKNTVIQFADDVTVGTDIDLFKQVRLALDLVKVGKADIYEYTTDEPIDGYKQYHIVVKGIDNIKEMYMPIGAEFSEYMGEVYKQFAYQFSEQGVATDVTEEAISDNSMTEERSIELDFYVACSKEDGRFTLVQSVSVDGMSVTNYVMDGYIVVDDWTLDNWWYENELNNAEDMAAQLKIEYDKIAEMLSNKLGVEAVESGKTTSENSVE